MKNSNIDFERGMIFTPRYVDEHGNAVERTKDKYRYSYSGFVTHRLGKNEEANCTVYSDRIMREEGYSKHCKNNFGNEGQMFFDRGPKQIEQFLRDFYDNQEIKLILVMEYCNVSSGFPLWRFDFYLPEKNAS